MKVACPNCGNTQEIDVEQGTGAVRARCEKCGTSYLVRVKARPKGSNEGGDLYSWFVRKTDGTMFSFPGDKQLHQGIRRGFVDLDDAISADGVSWTTISSLPILAAFMDKWKKEQAEAEPEAIEAAHEPEPEPEPEWEADPGGTLLFDSPPGEDVLRQAVSQVPTMEIPAQGVPATSLEVPAAGVESQDLSADRKPSTAPEVPSQREEAMELAENLAAARKLALSEVTETTALEPPTVAPATEVDMEPAEDGPATSETTALEPAPEPVAEQAPTPAAAEPPAAKTGDTQDDMEWGDSWNSENMPEKEMTGMDYYVRKRRINFALGIVLVLLGGAAIYGLQYVASLDLGKKEKKESTASGWDVRKVEDAAGDVVAADGVSEASPVEKDVVAPPEKPADAKPAAAKDVVSAPAPKPTDLVAASTVDVTGQPEAAGDVKSPTDSTPAPAAGEADVAAPAPDVAKAVPTAGSDAPDVAVPTPKTVADPPAGIAVAPGGDSDGGQLAVEKEKKKKEKKKKEEKKKKKKRKKRVEDDDTPRGFDALMNKGDKKRKGGRCAEALGYYLQALRLKPGYSEANYKVADCYRREGDCKRAITHYKEAIARSGFRNAYVGLARCYRSLGKMSEAKKTLEEGLERYDDGMMKMMLQELGG